MFLLQLSCRKTQNSTVVQKHKCTRAVRTGSSTPLPVTTERCFDHLKPILEKNRLSLISKAPTGTKKVYSAGRNSAGLCRQTQVSKTTLKQLEEHGIFRTRTSFYNNLTSTQEKNRNTVLPILSGSTEV